MNPPLGDADLTAAHILCSPGDLNATFDWLLVEMRATARMLRPDERAALRTVMARSAPLTVRELFPTFTREGKDHATLRRLRAGKFIRPLKTGRWEPDEPVAATPFARLVWDQFGEERLFAPPGKGKSKGIGTDTPPAAPVTWDNLVERVRERQKQNAAPR